MLDQSHPQIDFAIRTVRDVCRLARSVQASLPQSVMTKTDDSPVTIADFAIQAYVGCRLQNSFPTDFLVAEESAAFLRSQEGCRTLTKVQEFLKQLGLDATGDEILNGIDYGQAETASRFWTLDPIDGTQGFLHKRQYVVALAFIERGRVQIGVLGCPELNCRGGVQGGGPGCFMIAVRGQGAWASPLDRVEDFRRLRVSDCFKPAQARLIHSLESNHTDQTLVNDIIRCLGIKPPAILMDSQAKHGVVAAGAADLLFYFNSPNPADPWIKIWDQASGALIVEEAGGRVSDLQGRPLNFSKGYSLRENCGVLVTNGHLHDVVLRGLQKFCSRLAFT
ncbi:MAG: inositol monophosphatase family protein [Candidatus Omnitrophica bacterium]|nr:inositol monophosphatase family protein [Candidatus Omnitrophota bacterium]